MSHTTRRLLALPAIVAVAGFTATGPALAHGGPVVRSAGPLSDLQPATPGPFDGASAAVQVGPPRTARTPCFACVASTAPTARPSGRTCTPGPAWPVTRPLPSATTTPTCSPASCRPRSARTPRCGSTSPSTTGRHRDRHAFRSCRSRDALDRHPRGGDRPPHRDRRRAAGLPAGGVVMVRGLVVGALAGAGWGVVARLFMRLLSRRPAVLVGRHAGHPRGGDRRRGLRGPGSRRPLAGRSSGGGWPPCRRCCSSSARAACSSRRRRAWRWCCAAGPWCGPSGWCSRWCRWWSSPGTNRRCHRPRWPAWCSWWPPARRSGGASARSSVGGARGRSDASADAVGCAPEAALA